MNNLQCTEADFLRDVKQHQMTVLSDDGINRHIRFQKHGTSIYSFDLITWPGHLCYTGDMGTYVFARIYDMFQFFKCKPWRPGETIGINCDYWEEKLLAVDRNANSRAYSPERFCQSIHEIRIGWIKDGAREGNLNKAERRELWEAVDNDVLSEADNGECAAYEAAMGFNHWGYRFSDFWEVNLKELTWTYIWACYAISWGIALYERDGQPVIAEKEVA